MNFKPCTCGSELFSIKQKVSGFTHYHVGAYGEEAYNGEMYDGLDFTPVWKYYRCVDCGKRAKEVE